MRKLLIATAALLALASPAAAQVGLQTTGHKVIRPQDIESCKALPNQAWCVFLEPTKPTYTSEIGIVRAADKLARKTFAASDDRARDASNDKWRSHADEVMAGTIWRGDCVDLASTVLEVLSRQGFPAERMWRASVSTKRTGVNDHMVGVVQTADGKYWIVGDTLYGQPYEMTRDLSYEMRYTAKVSDGLDWYRTDLK